MSQKSIDTFKQEILESLAILEREIWNLAFFPPGWQSIAVQLDKLLCDGKPPLLKRVVENPTFHPMAVPIQREPGWQIFIGCGAELGKGWLEPKCFNKMQPPIPLDDWLKQFILVSGTEYVTIKDLIKIMRNKEAAHSHPLEDKKVEAVKNAFTISFNGYQLPSSHMLLATVGAYAAPRIRQILQEGKCGIP
jgi:hypothetical protein